MNLNSIPFGNITVSNVTSLTLVAELPPSFRNDCGVGFSFFTCEDNSDPKQSALPSGENYTNRRNYKNYKNTALD